MKSRLLIGLMSFALGLNTALLVVTVVKVDRMERRELAREAGGGSERPMLWGLPQVDPQRLKLTEAQQLEITRLREQWREEELKRRQALLERREQIPDIFQDDSVTMEELLPFLDQAHEESKARMETLLRYYRAYQEILTPEQEEEFKAMIREQQQRHQAMRREARTRIEQFMEMRQGGENRPRGERLRRFFGRNAPVEESRFGPGGPPMPEEGMMPSDGPMPPDGAMSPDGAMPPGGPMREDFHPAGEMPQGPGPGGEPSDPLF